MSLQFGETVVLMVSALGERHPDALVCRANLALAQAKQAGVATNAAVTQAIDDLAERLGFEHPSVVTLHAGRLLYRITDPQDPF